MLVSDLVGCSLAEVGGLIRQGVVSPVEVTRACLDQIERFDGRIGAFVTVSGEMALEQARRAEKEILGGEYRGPLHGVPISLKDLIDTEGIVTTGGSASLRGRVPARDAWVVSRLKHAGAIVIGKAQTYEFAMGPTSSYPFGRTRNPWDLDRVTIGSSSGSAASVRMLMNYASIGSDTGGSIRGPASACGVVGFKPSFGRIGRSGVLPLSWSMDHLGPLTRTVEDAAIVTNGLLGRDPGDRASYDSEPIDVAAIGAYEVRGKRIGVPQEYFFDGVDPQFQEIFERTLTLLEDNGAHITSVKLPDIEAALTAHSVIVLKESGYIYQHLLANRHTTDNEAIYRRQEIGKSVTLSEYFAAQRIAQKVARRFKKAISGVDVLINLTGGDAPPRFDVGVPKVHGADGNKNAINRFTRYFSLVDSAAVTVPVGFVSSGLPVGLHVSSANGSDGMGLAVADMAHRLSGTLEVSPPLLASSKRS